MRLPDERKSLPTSIPRTRVHYKLCLIISMFCGVKVMYALIRKMVCVTKEIRTMNGMISWGIPHVI